MALITSGVATASSTDGTSFATGGFTPVAGDTLFGFVVASDTIAPGTMTDSQSLGWTQIVQATYSSAAGRLYAFVANAKAAATGGTTVTFDCTGDTATGAIVFVVGVGLGGRVGLDALRQVATANDLGAVAPAATFAQNCLTQNPTIGFCGNLTNPAGLTPPTSWTELADTGYATPTIGGENIGRATGFTGTAVTWGAASASSNAVIVLELDASIAPFTSDIATSDDHFAGRLDMNAAKREFLQAVYETSSTTDLHLDLTTMMQRFFAANGVDRPTTSDAANFYTYLEACARGGNTSTGFT